MAGVDERTLAKVLCVLYLFRPSLNCRAPRTVLLQHYA